MGLVKAFCFEIFNLWFLSNYLYKGILQFFIHLDSLNLISVRNDLSECSAKNISLFKFEDSFKVGKKSGLTLSLVVNFVVILSFNP